MANAHHRYVAEHVSDDDLRRLLGKPLPRRPLNIVVVGAHPDDPETGCGGSIAKFVRDGHLVSIVYLTRGEAGRREGDHAATARIRTAEALEAAEILGADAVFANQIDGKTSAEAVDVSHFVELLTALRPDIVFTHWPLDTHRDHRNTAALTRAAWEQMRMSFELVYYEVMTGIQTYGFEPNVYVDVSSAEDTKRAAIYAHLCQNPSRFYPHHVEMEKSRGAEAGMTRAEAFVVLRPSVSRA